MPEYAYTTVTGKLNNLLSKLKDMGIPAKATIKWLESIGFKSTNDRTMLAVLEQIGFMSSEGTPQETWKLYRGSNCKAVLAEAIRTGYADLFMTYPDANTRTTAELADYFKTKSTAGPQVIEKTVSTFKVLCELAAFAANPLVPLDRRLTPAGGDHDAKAPTPARAGHDHFSPNLHIDIQIHISPDTPPELIDKMFASMAKYLNVTPTDHERA